MTVLADKFEEALNAKNNDIKNFVWKGEKKFINGEKVQTEMKLIDATPEQLNQFYSHCKSMLYSEDKVNPGRYVLLGLIREQRNKCNAELFLRYLEGGNDENGRKRYPRFTYMQALRDFLDLNKEVLPKENWKTTPIGVATNGIPEEFSTLTIDTVLDACLDTLGVFEKKHVTLNFITKMGLWFEPQEMKDLTEKGEDGKVRDRLAVVRERLNLKNVEIKFNPNKPRSPYLKLDPKGLSYTEFRAMVTLKSKKYSDMTTDQLTTLRDKVLFRLEDEVSFHASQWENRIKQIEKVADAKSIELEGRVSE